MQRTITYHLFPVLYISRYKYCPCLESPLFRTLGTFGEVSRAEVRAQPASIYPSHHPALVVSE